MDHVENIKSAEPTILFGEKVSFAQSFQKNLSPYTKLKQMIQPVLKVIGTDDLPISERTASGSHLALKTFEPSSVGDVSIDLIEVHLNRNASSQH